MTYNTTASLDKLNCTNSVDFGKNHERVACIPWSKNDYHFLDVKLKVFKRDENRDLRLVQIVTMGEVDFNQFKCLRNQLVIAAETFVKKENLSPVLIAKTTEDMHEQLKLAHKVLDVVDSPYKKIFVRLCYVTMWTSWRVHLCTSLIISKEEGEREVPTKFPCEI